MKCPNFDIVRETQEYILIRDLGPWDEFPTITNVAELVVEKIAPRLSNRRLYYIDSDGNVDEICVLNGRFDGFEFGGPSK